MRFVEAVKLGLKNWNTYSGRTSSLDYWCFFLFVNLLLPAFVFLIIILLSIILRPYLKEYVDVRQLTVIVFVGFLIFVRGYLNLPMAVRRLHDLNLSGWWCMLYCLPLTDIVMLILFIKRGDPLCNKYGEPVYAIKNNRN